MQGCRDLLKESRNPADRVIGKVTMCTSGWHKGSMQHVGFDKFEGLVDTGSLVSANPKP